MKQAIITTTVLLFSILIVVSWWFWQDMQDVLQKPVNLEQQILFEIEPGMSLQSVTGKLHRQGILKQPHYLILEARRQGMAEKLKAGEYRLEPGMTPVDLLELFVSGTVIQYALTIIEGWTVRDLLHAVREYPNLEHTLENVDTENLLEAIQVEGEYAEGQFFPDTYHFPGGTTDVEFLRRAWFRMQEILSEEWSMRAEDLPYRDAGEALIMASIIEKETGIPEERAEIAGVFVRRLQKGMKLQTDPTVIYALQEQFDGDLRRDDMQVDSPYNTYLYAGLPPTPIALPGREAVHAALHPAEGKTLYFVAKGDGSHYFSETLAEHNKAVARYQLNKKDE